MAVKLGFSARLLGRRPAMTAATSSTLSLRGRSVGTSASCPSVRRSNAACRAEGAHAPEVAAGRGFSRSGRVVT